MGQGIDARALQINPGAADETGIFIAFGGVAYQIRRLVHDKQVCILVDDVEQRMQIGTNAGRLRTLADEWRFPAQIFLRCAPGFGGTQDVIHLLPVQ